MAAALAVASTSKPIRCNISFALFPYSYSAVLLSFCALEFLHIISLYWRTAIILYVTRYVDILSYCYSYTAITLMLLEMFSRFMCCARKFFLL